MNGARTLKRDVIEIATLSSKGQITLPKWIRDSLNLNKGDKVIFDIESLSEDGVVNLTLRKNTIKSKQKTLDELLVGISNDEAAQIMSENYVEITDTGNEIVY